MVVGFLGDDSIHYEKETGKFVVGDYEITGLPKGQWSRVNKRAKVNGGDGYLTPRHFAIKLEKTSSPYKLVYTIIYRGKEFPTKKNLILQRRRLDA